MATAQTCFFTSLIFTISTGIKLSLSRLNKMAEDTQNMLRKKAQTDIYRITVNISDMRRELFTINKLIRKVNRVWQYTQWTTSYMLNSLT